VRKFFPSVMADYGGNCSDWLLVRSKLRRSWGSMKPQCMHVQAGWRWGAAPLRQLAARGFPAIKALRQ